MSQYALDADFRGIGGRVLCAQTRLPVPPFPGAPPFDPGVPPTLPPIEPIIPIACGETKSASLTIGSVKAILRSTDQVENQRYYARYFTFEADEVGTYTFTFSGGFVAVMTAQRDIGKVYQSVGNTLTIPVTNQNSGPFLLEVTSQAPYAFGDFTVHMTCPSTLAAYWKFDESASPWNDSVGSYHITFSSASVIADATGKISGALKTLTPTVSYLGPFTAQLRKTSVTESFTVAGWFKLSGDPSNRPWEFIHKIGSVATYGFRMFASTTSIQVNLYDNASHNLTATYSASIAINTFHFFCCTFDADTQKISVQLNNNSPVLSAAFPVTVQATDTVELDFQTPLANIFWLDEVGYWKTLLSPAGIAYLYNSGTGRTYPDVPGV